MDRGGRHIQRLSDLLVGEASEVVEFDRTALPLLKRNQTLQSLIEFDHVVGPGLSRKHTLKRIEVQRGSSPTSLLAPALAGMVYQNTPHRPRGNAHEMPRTLPVYVGTDEAYVRFVDEGRGLKGVAARLTAELGARQTEQFGVHER